MLGMDCCFINARFLQTPSRSVISRQELVRKRSVHGITLFECFQDPTNVPDPFQRVLSPIASRTNTLAALQAFA